MCLRPIAIRNPTRNIHPIGGQQLQLTVPCGQCAECVQSKRNEWYFRSYHEVQNTLKNGGYVYFDTLTYSDKYLPRISDFVDIAKYGIKDHSCFNHRHFRLFLKRMRRQLSYHYNNVSFKYFLTSEYGSDDRYTHRPHYHILFYVFGNIEPLEFSSLVAKAWQYGRTDGVPYKSNKYVAQHIYGRDIGYGYFNDFTSTSLVCTYVSKYITKSSKFNKVLNKRIDILKQHIDDEDKIKDIIRTVDMFHRQSREFGLSYIQNLDDRAYELLRDNKCELPDSKKIVRTYPLPMYYKRHLYYTNKKRDDDTRYWEPSPAGIDKILSDKLHQVSVMTDKLNNLYLNCTDYEKTNIDTLLSDRSFEDFALYKIFYKGRLRCVDSYNPINSDVRNILSDIEYNLYDWLTCIKHSLLVNSQYYKDVMPVVDGNVYFTDEHLKFTNYEYLSPDDKEVMPLDNFVKSFSITEKTDKLFYNFDALDSYIIHIERPKKTNIQKTFNFLEEYKERMKLNKLL